MKVTIIGRSKPFWQGKLREIGSIVEVPKEIMESKSPPSWAKPVRARKAVIQPIATKLID